MRHVISYLALVGAVVFGGCGSDSVSSPDPAPGTLPSTSTSGAQGAFATDLVQRLVLPDRAAGEVVPLIVLVPGGGWATADPTGLVPLANHLAGLGAGVSLTTHRAGDDDVYFPDQPADVACAVNASAAAVRDAGFSIGEVTVVGHSSGAHLASLIALRPEAFSSTCSYPLVTADRLVGLAGPYDVSQAGRIAGDLFGPHNTDPANWAEANPVAYADQRPELKVLLIHGSADSTVPMAFTDSFAVALNDGGHAVTVIRPAEADHHSIYSPDIGGYIIAEWLNW